MNTTTDPRGVAGAPVASPSTTRLTWRGIARSEWIRLVSTRSTSITLLASGVVMALIGLLAAAVSTGSVADPSGGPAPGFSDSDPMGTLMAGSTMVILIIGVLGVMVGAREYGSGLARTTYSAVPRRWPVLVSRIGVFALAATVVIGLGTLVAFAGGTSLLEANDATTVSFGDDGVGRALVGNVAYLVGTGVLGIAIGTLTRSLGLGIGALIALVVVVPGFGSVLLPDDWQGALDYLPSQAATSFTSVDAGSDYLGLVAGVVVFLAWVIGSSVAATVALLRRDA